MGFLEGKFGTVLKLCALGVFIILISKIARRKKKRNDHLLTIDEYRMHCANLEFQRLLEFRQNVYHHEEQQYENEEEEEYENDNEDFGMDEEYEEYDVIDDIENEEALDPHAADVIERNTFFYKYKNDKPNVNFNGNNSENCAICISKFYKNNNVRRLRCMHFFHKECVDKWLVTNKHCPICRIHIENHN